MSIESILIYIGIPIISALGGGIIGSWLYFGRKCDAHESRMDVVERGNYEFKLYCSQQYATLIYTKDVESRMVGALNRIENKLDKLADQLVDSRADWRSMHGRTT